eukprot:c16174_g1_i2.p1 GENE.c16174_g1_i2~~c16174_g1_i2.p1  ORF type:complete len:139 (+),score=47.56 c16174_g1_i2:209-625(+)
MSSLPKANNWPFGNEGYTDHDEHKVIFEEHQNEEKPESSPESINSYSPLPEENITIATKHNFSLLNISSSSESNTSTTTIKNGTDGGGNESEELIVGGAIYVQSICRGFITRSEQKKKHQTLSDVIEQSTNNVGLKNS